MTFYRLTNYVAHSSRFLSEINRKIEKLNVQLKTHPNNHKFNWKDQQIVQFSRADKNLEAVRKNEGNFIIYDWNHGNRLDIVIFSDKNLFIDRQVKVANKLSWTWGFWQINALRHSFWLNRDIIPAESKFHDLREF